MAGHRTRFRSIARASAATGLMLVAGVAFPTTTVAGSSIRKVLDFDYVGQTTIPAKTAPNLLTPSQCRTFTYAAGPGEVAVASVAATASPSVSTEGSLRIAVTRSLPLQPFVAVNVAAQVESFADGTAMVSARARIPLQEGTTYQFGAGFAADAETDLSTFSCQGTVVIYSEEP